MSWSKLTSLNVVRNLLKPNVIQHPKRQLATEKLKSWTHLKSGALREKPKSMPIGIVFVTFTVTIGLFIGAEISKNFALFLEENDIFVASDDDDDEQH